MKIKTLRLGAILAFALACQPAHACMLLLRVGGCAALVPGMKTPILSSFQPGTTTSTYYGGVQSDAAAAATGIVLTSKILRQVPIAYGGIISGLAATSSNGTVTGAGAVASVTLLINGANATSNCNFPATAPAPCTDTTHSDPVNAGDLLQYQFSPGTGGTWPTQTLSSQVSAVFTSSSGQNGVILTGPTSSGTLPTGATSTFFNVGAAAAPSTTEINASGMLSPAGTIDSLFVWANGANAGANGYTFTVFKNGAAGGTPLTVTIAPNVAATGACVTPAGTEHIGGASGPTCGAAPSGSALSFVTGDTISIQATCTGTCVSFLPGIGLHFIPTTPGQVPLFAQGGNPTLAGAWFGVSDSTFFANNANFEQLPVTANGIVFSNLQQCSAGSPGAGNRTATLLSGATPGVTPPTTALATTAYTSGSNCPHSTGSSLAAWFGIANTGASAAIASSSTVATNVTTAASASNTGQYKIGMTAVAP